MLVKLFLATKNSCLVSHSATATHKMAHHFGHYALPTKNSAYDVLFFDDANLASENYHSVVKNLAGNPQKVVYSGSKCAYQREYLSFGDERVHFIDIPDYVIGFLDTPVVKLEFPIILQESPTTNTSKRTTLYSIDKCLSNSDILQEEYEMDNLSDSLDRVSHLKRTIRCSVGEIVIINDKTNVDFGKIGILSKILKNSLEIHVDGRIMTITRSETQFSMGNIALSRCQYELSFGSSISPWDLTGYLYKGSVLVNSGSSKLIDYVKSRSFQ